MVWGREGPACDSRLRRGPRLAREEEQNVSGEDRLLRVSVKDTGSPPWPRGQGRKPGGPCRPPQTRCHPRCGVTGEGATALCGWRPTSCSLLRVPALAFASSWQLKGGAPGCYFLGPRAAGQAASLCGKEKRNGCGRRGSRRGPSAAARPSRARKQTRPLRKLGPALQLLVQRVFMETCPRSGRGRQGPVRQVHGAQLERVTRLRGQYVDPACIIWVQVM